MRCRAARGGPSSTSSSVTSRTLAVKALARSAHCGSSASRRSYSFIDDPHPAALTTTRSTPADSKASMVRRANARASSARPACTASAPQQPCAGWRQHLAALGREHAHGRLVDVREDQPLDAAGQQADGQAAFADGRRPPGDPRRQRPDRHRRRELGQGAQRGAAADRAGRSVRAAAGSAGREPRERARAASAAGTAPA